MGVRDPGSNPTAAVTGGTIDGAVIGGSTPAAITGTTINATTGFVTGAAGAGTVTIGASNGANAGWIFGNAASVASGAAGFGYVWATSITPTNANYSLASSGSATNVNAGTTVALVIANASKAILNASTFSPFTNALIGLGSANVGWKQVFMDFTNTGTVGSVTINKPSGRVNLAAAGTTLTLTNSLITAASKVFLQMASAPGNAVAVSWVVVPAAGSAVITCTPAVTNQTAIDFFVVNAD